LRTEDAFALILVVTRLKSTHEPDLTI
jgi:hypothetical protein